MSSLHYHNSLARQLHHRGMPASYIRRTIDELCDHCTDLQNASVEAVGERLGDAEQLADQFAVEYRRRTCVARHPIATLFLVPLVLTQDLLIVYFCGLVLLLVALFETVLPELGIDPYSGTASVVLAAVGTWLHRIGLVAPVVVSAIVTSRIGLKVGRGRAWTFAACVIDTAIVLFCATTLHLPYSATDKALLVVYFPAINEPSGHDAIGLATRLLFGLAPVCAGLLLVGRWYHKPDACMLAGSTV